MLKFGESDPAVEQKPSAKDLVKKANELRGICLEVVATRDRYMASRLKNEADIALITGAIEEWKILEDWSRARDEATAALVEESGLLNLDL